MADPDFRFKLCVGRVPGPPADPRADSPPPPALLLLLPPPGPRRSEAQVAYPSAEAAAVVCRAVGMDKELTPAKVRRTLAVEGAALVLTFEATELRLLRASVSTLLDLILLSTRAVERFPALPG